MRLFRSYGLALAVALGTALLTGAFAVSARAADELWTTDFKAALAKAKAEKKSLLVDFTGSDWCGWCIKLRKEVFEKEPFKTDAAKQYVLVELDFPHEKKLPDELKKQNQELSEKYSVRGFPTVLLMDSEGAVIARTGYRDGGPEKYLAQLAEFSKIYEGLAALKGKLDKATGLDRAKLLDEIVEGYQKLGNEEADEVAAWSKEIIALDPDNKAGLKVKYEFPLVLAEAQKLAQSGKTAEAKEVLDKGLALKGVPAALRQKGFMAKGEIALRERKFVEVVAALNAAKEAAPDTPMAKQIDNFIRQFSKAAEAQAAVAKLEADLSKAKGLDRAKLLDKLVDAQQALVRFDPQAGEKIRNWSEEIVKLDADNKAGLKKKYELKVQLAEAQNLMRTGKADEADAALDKVLATAGISGDDTQKAEFLKSQIAYMQQKQDQAVAHLKKALEAAPEGEMAPVVKMMLRQLDRPKKPAPKKAAEE